MSKRPPPTGGRRSKLTAELIGQFEATLQNHNTVAAACDMLGIARETFYRWLREGEEAKGGLKRDFCDTVKRAQGMSQVLLVNKISSDPSWQAKAWLLERLHPHTYGRRQLIAHAGPDGETPLAMGQPATAVKLTINMQQADGTNAPWVFKPEQDSDDPDGTDSYPTDLPDWTPPPPRLTEQAPPPERPSATPGRGPAGTPKPAPGLSATKIVEAIKNALPAPDSGGRPTDPDAS